MLDLIASARTGDREAFGKLAALSIDRLYAVAVRIAHDPYRAEDAVQTALLKAWSDLPSLRDASRFDAWLYRLVVRACYDEGRRHRAFVAKFGWCPMSPRSPTARHASPIATGWRGPSLVCRLISTPWSSSTTTRASPSPRWPKCSPSPLEPLARGCTTRSASSGPPSRRLTSAPLSLKEARHDRRETDPPPPA